jgi:membrane-associated protease RseP (regulator of RpoE activity)
MKVRHSVSIGLAGLGVLAVVATAPALMGAQAGPADLARLEQEQTQEAKAQAEKKAQAEAKARAEHDAQERAKVIVREKSGPVVVEVQEGDQPDRRVIVREGAGPLWVGEGGPRLGIRIRDVGKDDVAKYKLASQAGVVVEEVTKESAAEKAGVKQGDVVMQLDGEAIRSAMHLTRLVRETAPGRSVKLGVMRDGKRMDLDATPSGGGDPMTFTIDRDRIRADVEKEMQALREKMRSAPRMERAPMPEPEPAPGEPPLRWRMEQPERLFEFFGQGEGPMAFAFSARGRLGVTVQELTPELAAYFGVKDGVLVSGVQADTPAAKAGLKAGDVITSVDDKAIARSSELVQALRDKDGEVTIGVTRDKKAMSLKATIEKPKAPTVTRRIRA